MRTLGVASVAAATVFLLGASELISLATAQSGAELARALRSNVVAIEARWPDGTVKDGFGFVVGQRNRTAYVATALHRICCVERRAGSG